MRMFPRDGREEEAEVMAFVNPPVDDDPAVLQAIDTVARRLIRVREKNDYLAISNDGLRFVDIEDREWEEVELRALALAEELDRGQGPFEAAHELLKRRAEA